MTFALRWPLHPAPNEGEALSSWLNRVASCYGMFADDLIFAECGSNKPEELGIASPPEFIKTLSQRSGLSVDQIYCMTISAYIPWLLDSLDGKLQNSLEEYAFQFSVLIQKTKEKFDLLTIGALGCLRSLFIARVQNVGVIRRTNPFVSHGNNH